MSADVLEHAARKLAQETLNANRDSFTTEFSLDNGGKVYVTVKKYDAGQEPVNKGLVKGGMRGWVSGRSPGSPCNCCGGSGRS